MQKNSRGNALFLILIAVALFAMLAYAVTQTSRGGGNISKEKAQLVAQQFLDFGNSVRHAHQRIRLLYNTDLDNINYSENGTGVNAIFDPANGGAVWLGPPADAYDGGGAYSWNFYTPSNNWSSWGAGTTANDSFIWILNLTPEVCLAINQIMGHGNTIPNDGDGGPIIEAFEGAHAFCYTDNGQPPEFIYVIEAQ